MNGSADQFRSIRHLTLSGVSFEKDGILNLTPLRDNVDGSGLPVLTALKRLELAFIIIGQDTAVYLSDLNNLSLSGVRLSVENAV